MQCYTKVQSFLIPANHFPWGRPRSGEGERGAASATKQKKPALRLACLVDYTGKISNLLEDLQELDRFAQRVEDNGRNYFRMNAN